jgi:U3 small nucleolar RNA-associated protein 21
MDDDSMDIDDAYKNYKSPDQLANELITLSLLPESRWKHLVDLDTIKVLVFVSKASTVSFQ